MVVDPVTRLECPPAEFDSHRRAGQRGRGDRGDREPVRQRDGSRATTPTPWRRAERLRDGWYWTGDLAYRDADGWFWFAGRGGDWLRVDSENLTAGPIERVLVRFADVATVAVYPVPDPRSGDQVMAALELLPGPHFDPDAFARFLDAQADLGTKWVPAFLRVTAALPRRPAAR